MGWVKLIVTCVWLGGILLLSGHAAERKLLIIGEAWAPFEFEEDGKVVGMDVDIIRRILQKMNIEFEMRIMTWSRAWAMVQEGQADAAFSVSRRDDRLPYLLYPKEDMWTSEFVFFTRRDKKLPLLNGYADAKKHDLQIGVVRDNTYNDEFWKVFPRTPEGKLHPQLQPARNAEVNFKKLARGRIDLYILDKTIGLYTIAKMKLHNELDYYDTVLFTKGYPMPFVKNSDYPNLPAIAERFEKELIALKRRGEYNKIRQRWLK